MKRHIHPVSSLPPVGGSSPLTVPKHRGRQKGSKNKPKSLPDAVRPKALAVFQHIVADTERLNEHERQPLVSAQADGGGTQENAPTITKESLERRISRRLNVLDRYLTDDMLHTLLTQSSLKEIGIYEGIMMDKSLVLKGQPTVIIGNAERGELDNLLPRLLREINRRGLITTATERKIEFVGTGGS